MTSDYTDKPVKLRIFSEPGFPSDDPGGDLVPNQWWVDGIDETGKYTESCWSFDTFEEAVKALPEFWAFVVKA